MVRSLIPSLFGGTQAARQVDPFQALQQQFNRAFEDFFRGSWMPTVGAVSEMTVQPRINVSETDKEYRVEAELPGVSADDVEVMLNEDILTIRGQKKAERSEQEESYHLVERSYGAFARSIRLPFEANPDDVSASYRNGVLTVSIPKTAAQEKAHRIEISKGAEQPEQQPGVQGSQATH